METSQPESRGESTSMHCVPRNYVYDEYHNYDEYDVYEDDYSNRSRIIRVCGCAILSLAIGKNQVEM